MNGRTASGGEEQRFAVLRAVAHDPKVVFADEPLAKIDVGGTRDLKDLLKKWKAGTLGGPDATTAAADRTLVLVTHDMETAVEMADHFVVLPKNRVAFAEFDRAGLPTDPAAAVAELKTLLDPRPRP